MKYTSYMARLSLAVFLEVAGVAPAFAVGPVANDATNEFTTGSVNNFVMLPYTDPDGGNMTFTLVEAPQAGCLNLSLGTGGGVAPLTPGIPTFMYFWLYSATNYSATNDTFTWTVCDGASTSRVATMTINLVFNNTVPVAQDGTIGLAEHEVRHPALMSYTHADYNQAMSFIMTEPPVNGRVEYFDANACNYVAVPLNTQLAAGQWYYARTNESRAGGDSFKWKVSDGVSTSDTATCSVDLAAYAEPRALLIRGVARPGSNVTLRANYADTNDWLVMTSRVVKTAAHGDVTVSGLDLTYTPQAGFKGVDSFEYVVNDGITDSDPALGFVMVRDSNERGGAMVELIVNDLLLPVLSNEVYRLKSDLVREGYDAKVVGWTMAGSTPSNLWAYLRAEYDDTNQFLTGAVLIGDLPKPRIQSLYEGLSDTDLIYWNLSYFQTAVKDMSGYAPKDIWVSRMNVDDTKWGSEEVLIRRALDANHNYRAGISRLPHTAFVFYASEDTMPDYTTMQEVWPEAKAGYGGSYNVTFHFTERADLRIGACDCFIAGGEIFNQSSHGNSQMYMAGEGFYTYELYNTIAQVRVLLSSSCSSGAFGGINNNHLFTRGGGLVLAVGGTGDNGQGDFLINDDDPLHDAFRALISAGESYGGAAIQQYGFHGIHNDRTVFYGDLSIGVMASPSNCMPVITSFTADKTTIQPGETVNFSMTYSDPDSGATNSPYVDYKHQVEWFPEGYDYGRRAPDTVTSSNDGAGTMSLSHTYNAGGKFVMRVEVTDEWQARTWKEVTVTVQSWPVASSDRATVTADNPVTLNVMTNDYDTGGQSLFLMYYGQPVHGTVTRSGNSLTYTPEPGWTGTDSFTYEIWNQLFYAATGTVFVTVVPAPLDANGDGVADAWAACHFPDHSPTGEAANDSDGDGMSNLQEYIAGTDPTNRNDRLKVFIACSNGTPVVKFDAMAASTNYYGGWQRHYALEYLTEITGANWQGLPGYEDVIAEGQAVTFSSSVATNMFFRVKAWVE